MLRFALDELDELGPTVRRVVEALLDLPVDERRRRATRALARRRADLVREAAQLAERDGVVVPVGHLMADDDHAAALALLSAL